MHCLPYIYILPNIGVLSALSGGDTHYFPDFDKNQHGYMFTHDLQYSLQREQGYNGALRLRCSNGKLPTYICILFLRKKD